MKSFKEQNLLGKIGFIFLAFFIIVLVVACLPFCLLLGIYGFLSDRILLHRARRSLKAKGKHGIFVYSNSPHWKEYIEANILPKVESKLIVLNWSERNSWKDDLLVIKVYKRWGSVGRYRIGNKIKWSGNENNPIAILVPDQGMPTIFKFWQAFKDYKHGKDYLLRKILGELFENLSQIDGVKTSVLNKGQ